MLYLVGTPIGNLNDLSPRAVDCFRESECIYCEDTRRTKILLDHANVKTPLKSYHKFSEAQKESEILSKLKQGSVLSLVSDAGTPALCDPGERLVKACVDEGYTVVPIPGPCALIQALVGSGLPTSPFQFLGFLPKKSGELKEAAIALLSYEGTSVCYESPHRIEKVLRLINALDPDRPLVLARELTKKFEEYIRGTSADLLSCLPIKGEIVLLVGRALEEGWHGLSIEEHVAAYEKAFSLPRKEAMSLVAKVRPVSKREIYQRFLKNL